MNYARTVGIANNVMTLFILFFANGLYAIEKRLIFFIFKLAALVFLYNFVGGLIFC